jgi:hypothetical protein
MLLIFKKPYFDPRELRALWEAANAVGAQLKLVKILAKRDRAELELAAAAIEAQRPLSAEERLKVLRTLQEKRVTPALPTAEEYEALARHGLSALAEMRPQWVWMEGMEPRSLEKRFFKLEYTAEAPSVHISTVGWWTRLERTKFELSGPRGRVSLEAGALRFAPASVDEETVELAERARRAAERLEAVLQRWREAVEALRWAERNLWRGRAPTLLAGEAEDPESGVRAWREGRRVAVWLEPEARRRVEERLAREGICSVEGYLALLSAQLGARVALAESDRWSPEVDAALKELQETLRRLAGA